MGAHFLSIGYLGQIYYFSRRQRDSGEAYVQNRVMGLLMLKAAAQAMSTTLIEVNPGFCLPEIPMRKHNATSTEDSPFATGFAFRHS